MYEVALSKTKRSSRDLVKRMREFPISFLEEFRFNKRMLWSKLDQGCQYIISDLQDQIHSSAWSQWLFVVSPCFTLMLCCCVPHLKSNIGCIELLAFWKIPSLQAVILLQPSGCPFPLSLIDKHLLIFKMQFKGHFFEAFPDFER